MWNQKEIILDPQSRGIHLITHTLREQCFELTSYGIGTIHIFCAHTSAGLCISENTDPTVRLDLNEFFNYLVPEDSKQYQHDMEGEDDMPAHIKSIVVGSSLTIPITDGDFNLGTWQGIYLCEFRNKGGARKLVVTLNGE